MIRHSRSAARPGPGTRMRSAGISALLVAILLVPAGPAHAATGQAQANSDLFTPSGRTTASYGGGGATLGVSARAESSRSPGLMSPTGTFGLGAANAGAWHKEAFKPAAAFRGPPWRVSGSMTVTAASSSYAMSSYGPTDGASAGVYAFMSATPVYLHEYQRCSYGYCETYREYYVDYKNAEYDSAPVTCAPNYASYCPGPGALSFSVDVYLTNGPPPAGVVDHILVEMGLSASAASTGVGYASTSASANPETVSVTCIYC